MKTILLALVMAPFLLAALTLVAAAPTSSGAIDFAALDTAIESQMQKHDLPGVSVAVIENGAVTYLKGYGVDGARRPMTPQTPVLIGSQSEFLIALAIAQLAEQRSLDLNASVQDRIPWSLMAGKAAGLGVDSSTLMLHK